MSTLKARDPMLEMTEKQWQSQVVQLAKQWGWRVFHPYLSIKSAPGFPDLHLSHEARRQVIYAELKREKGKLTERQGEYLDHLRACGQQVFVWRPSDLDEVIEILTGARVVL